MKQTNHSRAAAVAVGAIVALAVASSPANAGFYPTYDCVAAKQKASGKHAANAAKAWAKYFSDTTKDPGGVSRDAAIAKSQTKLDETFTKAEDKAASQGAECVETTETSTLIGGAVAAAVAQAAADITDSMDSGDKADVKCRTAIIKAVGKFYSSDAAAFAKLYKDPTKDGAERNELAANREKAALKFSDAVVKAQTKATGTCDLGAISDTTLAEDVAAGTGLIVQATTTSPGLPENTWTEVVPPTSVEYRGQLLAPLCSKDTPYSYWVKRGTVNKLLVYYQGGGACWSNASCWTIGTYDQDVQPSDNPGNLSTGFGDLSNPDNPFADWNAVFISYCTGDVHWGSNDHAYGSLGTNIIRHRGRQNAAVVEKWVREHFLDPEQVFVTGSSAGSYGAIMNSTFLMEYVYPWSQFDVLGDAGTGVITEEWLQNSITNWGAQAQVPDFVPGLGDVPVQELSSPEMWELIAQHYPQHRFAQYQSLYDGSGGGQAAFFNVMANPDMILNWTQWWTLSCEWSACMQDFVDHIYSTVPNFRFYTGTGTRHTIFGSDKVYADTEGGVVPLVDWLNEMMDHSDTVGWDNVATSDETSVVNYCQGGASAGLTCVVDGDCGGGTCEQEPDASPNAPYTGGEVICAPTVCPCADGMGGGLVTCPAAP